MYVYTYVVYVMEYILKFYQHYENLGSILVNVYRSYTIFTANM